jgi:uncharacterized protein YggU (UPF0235/DUF167 family)
MCGCTFEVILKPRAKKNGIKIGGPGVMEVTVTSPPIDNKANEHLIRLLADALRLPKSSIQIIRGDHSKKKAVAIASLSGENVMEKLKGNPRKE